MKIIEGLFMKDQGRFNELPFEMAIKLSNTGDTNFLYKAGKFLSGGIGFASSIGLGKCLWNKAFKIMILVGGITVGAIYKMFKIETRNVAVEEKE